MKQGGAADDRRSSPSAGRLIMRRGLKAALATIGHERAARDGGWPRVSLVSTACDCDGAPILLLSDIALHSREIRRDNRVSRLFDLAGK